MKQQIQCPLENSIYTSGLEISQKKIYRGECDSCKF